jgi:hypothetical protein
MTSEGNIKILTEPPAISDGVLAVTNQSLLPCLIWKDIEVTQETRRELTVVERFIIAAGLRLEQLSPQDVEEITSLPVRAARRLLLRLCSTGIFTPGFGGGFEVMRERAESALSRKAVSERRSVKWSFVFLPRTDDLIAFNPETPQLNEISRLKATCQAPVPSSVAGSGRLALLRERILKRRIINLPENVVELSDFKTDTKIENLCPAYACRGELRLRDKRQTLRFWLTGFDKKNKEAEYELEFMDAPGLAKLWADTANSLAEPTVQESVLESIREYFGFAAGIAPELRQRGPSRYTAVLTKAAAESLPKRFSLIAPFGLTFRRPEWWTELEISFEPDTKAAAVLFATDKAVALLSQSMCMDENSIETAIREAVGTYDLGSEHSGLVTTESVLDRLWVMGRFHIIYSGRAATDFNYEHTP